MSVSLLMPSALLGQSGEQLLGRTEPRLWTPPLRELTPETSYGFDVIDFARDVLNTPLDPWEEWCVIHAGELLEDGITPRFRTVLILVARQNGKTTLLRVLKLYWLFVEEWPVILGTSTDRNYAKMDWRQLCDIAATNPLLRKLLPRATTVRSVGGVSGQPGDESLRTSNGCEYRFAANNRRAGRSMSIDRLVIDELREHQDWDAWNAATNAMNARPYGQVYCITNQGDDNSLVLNSLRDSAMKYLDTGEGDPRLGLFEWSAPDGADILDREAWAMANPNLGRRLPVNVIEGPAQRAAQMGGKEETGFRTEILCQRVRALDAAVDPVAWQECKVPGDLSGLRSRIALCVDLSPDRQHATLAAAGVMEDGRARVEVVESWNGPDATRRLRKELPEWITKIRPQAIGWMPSGPAAALAADLKERKGRTNWPPTGVSIEEIRGEISAICMGLSEQVQAKQIVHSDQPLLNTHVTAAAKLWSGDVWKFSRKGGGHCDAAYAAAGAIHLARTLPTPIGKPRLVVATAV